MRKPVPLPITEEELLVGGFLGAEEWVVRRGTRASSVAVVVGLTQVSVRQKRSGWQRSIRLDNAAEWRGWRIERMLKVQRVKFTGPGLSSISPERRRKIRLKETLLQYTVSKNCAKLFCQNFVNFPRILIIFGREVAKRLELCKVHSFSTSSNLRRHTTALNADVPNCHTTLKVVICYNLQ